MSTSGRYGLAVSGGTAGGAGIGMAFSGLWHGYHPAVIIAVLAASVLVALAGGAVRVYELRAKRSAAQIRATALAARARRVSDPEQAMRLLIADKASLDRCDGNQVLELLRPTPRLMLPPPRPGLTQAEPPAQA